MTTLALPPSDEILERRKPVDVIYGVVGLFCRGFKMKWQNSECLISRFTLT